MSSAWFSSDITFIIEDKQLNLGLIRSGNLVPQSESFKCFFLLFVCFCMLQVGCYVFCNHSAIKARSVKGFSDGCPYETLPHQDFRNSVHVTLGFLVTSITKAISPPSNCLVGQATNFCKSSGCLKPLPFENYGAHCALENLQCSRSAPCNNPILHGF